METQMTTLSAGIMLFLIMDPLGNIPFFLSLLKDVPPKRRRLIMVRELLIALGVLLVFLFGGQHILELLQLKPDSISIAGGIVLFLIGIRMVFPPADGSGIFGKPGGGEPFIVPMAIPGVAGPSAMAALLLLTNTQPVERVDGIGACNGHAADRAVGADVHVRRGVFHPRRCLKWSVTRSASQVGLSAPAGNLAWLARRLKARTAAAHQRYFDTPA